MTRSDGNAEAFYDARPWLHSYGEGVGTELDTLPDRTLGALIRRSARTYEDKTAFTLCLDNGMHASLSFREVDHLSDQFAAWLRNDLGLQPGERVAVQMPNCLSYPVAAFGTLKAGLILVNMNPLYTAREMNQQLQDCGAAVLVLINLFADKLETALKNTGVRTVLLADIAEFFPWPKQTLIRLVLKLKRQLPGTAQPTQPFAEALRLGRSRLGGAPFPESELDGDALALLQYTGGTTGVPKGAMLSHSNLLANLAQTRQVAGPTIRKGEDVILTALPLYHIFAFTFNLMTFYMEGCRNILCPNPRPPSNLRKAFQQFQVTKFSGVNVLFHALCHEDWFRESVPPIDMTISGGTALHASVAQKWKELVGSELCEGYGLTEASPVVAANQPTGEIILGTIGVPLPGTDVRIVDDDGNCVPPGEPGELAVRGPQVFQGYWNRPEETAKCMRDDWFLTGDVATMDERGYLRIVDRKKDMIDVSGFNVYPNEVEEVLESHPDIAEAGVVGMPRKEGIGEVVYAYVVSRNAGLTEQEVITFAREQLTGYKVPKRVVFRKDLPKTPVGKILRKNLRDPDPPT